jgi:16S rRNA (uracil1498-N3)-methyltransferase
LKYLSNIELYYTPKKGNENGLIILKDEEFKHCIKVMRHSVSEDIYVTDGNGKIFLSGIKEVKKDFLTAFVKKLLNYKNKYHNVFFCIPRLKNNDRFEFALEKCTELGITNFVIFDSERAIHKSDRKERWQKIVISAMKQSLRSYLPVIATVNSLTDIYNLKGNKIILEQNSEKKISELKMNREEKYYFIFGPEGGFTDDELGLFDKNDFYSLADNRLRTETAVIKCASLLETFEVSNG